MKRRRSDKGESLIETMLSLLVIALGLVLLTGAIQTSAKINSQSASENVMLFMSTDSGDTVTVPNCTVEFELKTSEKSGASVTCCLTESENGGTPLAYYK